MDSIFNSQTITAFLMSVVAAGAILIVGFWLSGMVKAWIIRIGKKHEELDDTLFMFLGSLARYAVLAFTFLAVLNRFGVQTTSVVALIGAAGLAIGLALQGTLSHLASGVMLVLFRPIKVGDFVTAGGQTGTVKTITLFTTELATIDNVQVTIPNGNVWGDCVINFSAYDTRRVDLVMGVSYDTDLKLAEKTLRDVIKKDKRIHADPEPFVKVGELGPSSVDFLVRVWCDRADFFELKTDLTRAIKEAFDAKGVDIPFPTTKIIQS